MVERGVTGERGVIPIQRVPIQSTPVQGIPLQQIPLTELREENLALVCSVAFKPLAEMDG